MFSNIVSGPISTLYNINGCRSNDQQLLMTGGLSAFRWLAELLMAGGISAYRWLAGDQLLDGWREIIKVLEVQVVGHLSVQVCERNC